MEDAGCADRPAISEVSLKLSREDFEAWRHSPLAELIFDRLIQDEMNVTKAQHDAEAWEAPLQPERHAAFRERYETLEFIRTLSFDQIEDWLNEEKESE